MSVFRVYKHEQWGDDDVKWAYEAVKEGFSWPALLLGLSGPLGIYWALAKRLWGYAAVLAGAVVAQGIAWEVADAYSAPTPEAVALTLTLVWVCLVVAMAFRGNAWRVPKLEADGYALFDRVEAKSAKAAVTLCKPPEEAG